MSNKEYSANIGAQHHPSANGAQPNTAPSGQSPNGPAPSGATGEPTFDFSRFSNKSDNAPKAARSTWPELCELLSKRSHRTNKNGPLFSGATYPEGATRGNGNAKNVTLAILDFDEGATLPEIESTVARLNNGTGAAAFLYSTFSHDPQNSKEKYRLTLPLAEPVPAAQWPEIWQRLALAFDEKPDRSAKDAARIHFLPSCPKERIGDAVAIKFGGVPLDISTLPALPAKAHREAPQTGAGAASGTGDDPYAQKAFENEIGRVAMATEGARNVALNKSALKLGHFVGAGRLNRSEVESALLNAATGAGLPEAEARATIKSGLDAGEAEPNWKGAPDENTPFAPFAPFGSADSKENIFFESAPLPLTFPLRTVPKFDLAMLPTPLRAWVSDAAERLSCPLDFVAVPVVVALASLVGRVVTIRPRRYDDWLVVANLWGAIIGRPGSKKTPAASEATRFLDRLQAEALNSYNDELKEVEIENRLNEVQSKAAQSRLTKAASKGASRAELRQIEAEDSPPEEREAILKRYLVNDATVEALGVTLKENPRGVLVNRDELTGWLHSLDKQGRETDKSFYLEAFNGTKQNFIYDRIGRGRLVIPHVCVSLFGTIQPGPLGQLVRAASEERKQRDGFISRFQLLVYPDPVPYVRVDRWPDTEAKTRAYEIFKSLDALTPEVANAQSGEENELPFLRFDTEAQEFFNEWLDALELQLAGSKETTLLEEHLSKYRSLMPSLALVFHLVNIVDGESQRGPVSAGAALQGAAWCEYLEAHARRIYGQSFDGATEALERLGERLPELPNPFTARDVMRKKWSGLTEREEVETLLIRLHEKHWIAGREVQNTGGRPTVKFWINPALLKKEKGGAWDGAE